MSKEIEVEIRSFISESTHKKLIKFLKKEGKFLGSENQETFYFDGPKDLRIQKNDNFSKVWLKEGKIHDDFREEVEIKLAKNDFKKIEKLFLSLGYKIKIKWFRKRNDFLWNGIMVAVDFTKGYGYIVELEKIVKVKEKVKTLELLKKKLKELGIKESNKVDFEKKFKYYSQNWQKLIK